MTILNFVSQDELDDLDDDPRIAFMSSSIMRPPHTPTRTRSLTSTRDAAPRNYIRHALQQAQSQGSQSLHPITRHSFMNVVIAAAEAD